MSGLGKTLNVPGHEKTIGINGAIAAANDAILETPSINLPSSATNAKLVFDVSYFKAFLRNDHSKIETLTLEVSTNGGSSWSQIQEVDGNQQDVWETKVIDISSYAGQSNLKFGFKYDNIGAQLIGAALDNVYILKPGADDISLLTTSPHQGDNNSYGAVNSNVTISGKVMNFGSSPISSYTVHYQQGVNPPVSTPVSGSIASFAAGTFNNVTFRVPAAGDFPLKVWVTTSGDGYHTNDSGAAFITGVPFMPVKRIVFEEATGTWCGWCPRGHIGMDDLNNQFPDSTTQIAVHNNDPMADNAYNSLVTQLPGFSGFPSIALDRRMIGDPGDIISMYNEHKNDFGFATVNMWTPNVSGGTVSASVEIKPAVSIQNAKLALVVTESNLRHEDQGNPPNRNDTLWMQHDYYSPYMAGGPNSGGNIQLPLRGFDHSSEYVDGMYYNFVARTASPSPAGGSASGIPPTMTPGTTYSTTLTATLNSSWNTSNLQFDVLLIGSDGTILNSAHSATPSLLPLFQDTVGITSIANVAMGINQMDLYPNPVTGNNATLTFNMTTSSKTTINVVDISGKVVYSIERNLEAGGNIISLPVDQLSNGNYFVTAKSEKGSATIKFVVNK